MVGEEMPMIFFDKDEPMDEKQLIKLAKGGDIKAFEILVNTHEKKIYSTAFWMLNNKDDALDVTQEVFLYAFQNLKKFREQSSFFTWINWILLDQVKRKRTKNKLNHFLKPIFMTDHSNEESELDFLAAKNDNPTDLIIKKEQEDFILAKINSLPDKYSLPIILCDLQNMSYREAADVLNCSESTIKIRLFRARSKLKDFLKALK